MGSRSTNDRFWEKVDKSGECWLWVAARNAGGFGKFHMHGIRAANGELRNGMAMAHRFAYEQQHGPTPAGMAVRQRCGNPRCVRPAHHELVAISADAVDIGPEEWRPIPDFPYEISDRGRVRRVREGLGKGRVGRILKPELVPGGYHGVVLYDHPRSQRIRIHAMVCEVFNGPRPTPEHVVRHLDGSRLNNVPGNLCWGTHAENAADRISHGRSGRGVLSWSAKLTQQQVDELRAERRMVMQGRCRAPIGWVGEAARRYGMSTEGIHKVCRGDSYSLLADAQG